MEFSRNSEGGIQLEGQVGVIWSHQRVIIHLSGGVGDSPSQAVGSRSDFGGRWG